MKHKILIADDEAEIRDLLRLYLENEGYDVEEDIEQIPAFQILKTEAGLFNNFQIDESRTCVFWSDMIDLPSDTLLEYGQKVK